MIVAVVLFFALCLAVAFLAPASAATTSARSPEPEEDSAAAIPELSFEEHCELLIEDD